MIVNRNTTHEALHRAGATLVKCVAPGVFDVEPPINENLLPALELDAAKAAKLDQLTISRDAATIANVIAHGRQWQADERSQKLLSAAITLAMAGAPLPPVWRDANNSNMPITTLAELVAIAGAMATQTQAAYSKSWTLKSQVDAAQTPGAVDAVVW